MRTYGFDYLTRKTILLVEKPITTRTPKNVEKWNEFVTKVYRPTLKEFQRVAKISSAPYRVKMYMVEQLTDGTAWTRIREQTVIPAKVDRGGNELSPAGKLREDYLDWLQGGSNDSNKEISYVLEYLASKDNYKKALSPDFVAKVTDPENIKNWAAGSSTIETSSASREYGKKVENLYGISAAELQRLKAEVYPILKKLNISMGAQQRIATRFGTKQRDANDPRNIADLMVSVYDDIISEFDAVQIKKEKGEKINTKNPMTAFVAKLANKNALEQEKKLFEDAARGKGIELEKVMKFIDKKVNSENPVVSELGEIIEEEFGNYVESEKDVEGKESLTKKIGKYDEDTIDRLKSQGKITDEEVEKLKEWIPYQEVEDKLRKGRKETKGADPALGEYLAKKEEEKARKKSKAKEDEEDENSVMGYMTEQVNKDSHFNKVGTFVDRGFKKPANYNQWLTYNREMFE